MKVVAVLLCALVAVQARMLQPFEDSEDLNVPYVVHLRIANFQGQGLLDSCVGTLYKQRWVITSASCVQDSRFVWVRYAAKNVYTPGYVTESSVVVVHPEYNKETGENDIALVNLNREIPVTDNIKSIELAASDAAVPETGKGCGYGTKKGQAGEDLFCVDIKVTEKENGILYGDAEEKSATKYDLGAAIVADDKVFGILTGVANDETDGVFLSTSKYVSWIEETTTEKEETFIAEPVLIAEPLF